MSYTVLLNILGRTQASPAPTSKGAGKPVSKPASNDDGWISTLSDEQLRSLGVYIPATPVSIVSRSTDPVERAVARMIVNYNTYSQEAHKLAAWLLANEKTMEKIRLRIRPLFVKAKGEGEVGKKKRTFLRTVYRLARNKSIKPEVLRKAKLEARLGNTIKKVHDRRFKIIGQLESGKANKTKLSAELARLDGALQIVSRVPDGSFAFADATEVSLKVKNKFLNSVLENNKEKIEDAGRTIDRLLMAKKYHEQVVATVQSYLIHFPADLHGRVMTGADDFPVISDSYSKHTFEGGPRAEIIEKLPIVKVFARLKKKNPEAARALVRDLTVALRSDLGQFSNVESFEMSFALWKEKFDAATRSKQYSKISHKLLVGLYKIFSKNLDRAEFQKDFSKWSASFSEAVQNGKLPQRANDNLNQLVTITSLSVDGDTLGKMIRQWHGEFIGSMSTPDHLAVFFGDLRKVNEGNRPVTDKLVDAAGFLDSCVDGLGDPSKWDNARLQALVSKLAEISKELGVGTTAQRTLTSTDFSDAYGELLYNMNVDPISEFIAGSYDFNSVVKEVKGLRKEILKKLSRELYRQLGKVTKLPVYGHDQSKAEKLISEIVNPDVLMFKNREKVMKELFQHLQYMQVDGMSTAMIKSLHAYRKMEKAAETCNSDLSLLGRVGCYGGRFIMGLSGDYYDPRFKPMADELIAIRKDLHYKDKRSVIPSYPRRTKAMAAFMRVWQGKWWPIIAREGNDVASRYKKYNFATGAIELVASMLVGHVIGKAVHGLVVARWGKGVIDAVRLARIARIASALETTAMTAGMTLTHMGLSQHTWFGYDFKNGRWAIPATIEQIGINAILFGFNKWLGGKYMKWLAGNYEKAGLDMAKLGWGYRMAAGTGRLGMTYLSFTAADGAINLYQEGKKKGFFNVLNLKDASHAMGKAMTWESMKNRAVLMVAFKAGEMMAAPLMKASMRKSLEMSSYREYFKNIQKSMESVMKGFEGNSEQVLRAFNRLELEMMRYAGMMESVGLKGTEQFSQIWQTINQARNYYRVFAPGYSVAGVRQVDGYFTYSKSSRKQLTSALTEAGATGITVSKKGMVNATLHGQTVTFAPRKPVTLKQAIRHPIKTIPELWNGMTANQKTAVWWLGPWAFIKVASKIDPVTAFIVGGSTLGAYGYHRYQAWRANRPSR